MEIAIILAVVVVALVFDYTNGFHDAANAIATSVSTGALKPRVALAMAAIMNFVGAFLGQKVAHTVSDMIDPGSGSHGLVIVMCGLLGAITWNLITWWLGLPSSSSQALIGGLVGAAIAAGATANWDVVVDKVVLPMLISPVIAFTLGFAADGRRSCGSSAGPTRAAPTAASRWPRPCRPPRWRSATACRTPRRRWA